MAAPELQRINIANLILLFVVYIVIHFIIAIKQKQYEGLAKEKPGNEAIETTYKWLTIANKWFPFAYLLFILITMA